MHKNNNIRTIKNYIHIDKELIEACIKGKKIGQKKLYEACYPFLMPMCMRFHRNNEDARAVFNKAFLKVLENIKQVKGKEKTFAAWARKIVHNTLIDEYRSSKKYKENINTSESEQTLDYFSKNARNGAVEKFNEQDILKLLDYLKPDTKKVFVLYVIEGYNHREISEMLTMSQGTSKWHLSLARKTLKEMIEKTNKNLAERLAI